MAINVLAALATGGLGVSLMERENLDEPRLK